MAVNLQSQAHRHLLDIIDKLRAQGISRYVDLPEIIVTGDQSAGKSSVLEAISGMTFPTKDNLCTRFATELILRRSPHVNVKVSIVPDADRPEEEQKQLKLFEPTIDASDPQLGDVIEEAKEVMGLNGPKKVFSDDILRVEMSGPEQPHLTMVDLPGLFEAGNSAQSDEDAELVTDMVMRYLMRPRSIILAVVSAKSDFALQKVTRIARELDPAGVRTLGLITKPDTLDEGSASEAAYVQLAQNRDVKFRLGWHVLKNRDYKMRNATSAERDEAEADFLSRAPWTSIDPSHLGVASLKPRLSNVLKDQILLQLPSLLGDVSDGIRTCKEKLDKLGKPRGSVREQRRYLLHTSQNFSRLMQAAVDGMYNDRFFGSARTEKGYRRRLRAVVQNTLTDFRNTMYDKGRSRRIVEVRDDHHEPQECEEVLRSDYVKEVKDLIRRNRGCELPGTFNPLIVGELFADQCRPWTAIAMDLKDEILLAVSETSHDALYHVAVEETAERILQIVNTGIEDLKLELDAAFEQVLEPYTSVHPITYNHYLIRNVQKAQSERRRREITAHIEKVYGQRIFDKADVLMVSGSHLSELLAMQSEIDMELYGSSLAVDYMEAYYKVALKTAVDAVGTLAIECRLLQKLPSIFDPEKIYDMSGDEVSSLAADSEATVNERAHLGEKLAVLETALHELKRLNSFRSVVTENHVGSEAWGEGKRATDVPIDAPNGPAEAEVSMPAEAEAEELAVAPEQDFPEEAPLAEEDALVQEVAPPEEDVPVEEAASLSEVAAEPRADEEIGSILTLEPEPEAERDAYGEEPTQESAMQDPWGLSSKKKKGKKSLHFADDAPEVIEERRRWFG
ncbi:dynamin family protein [Hirsutella rhossiliensis]|uniref:Dynamin family domain-containing protein n=1 Tax=Hirsutella rhossiliensis TaxID=111463 RepID=A0A9P8N0A4_9HYPO|nr:dynamin family domain-containing protein [Hirsutella rhossiliensis]KAH0963566.1 dynamin family domain-containing protein [Hirsutella rhossiliensis]